MADTPTEDPAGDAGTPHKRPSPPTRKQHRDPAPPKPASPPPRAQGPDAAGRPSPPTRHQDPDAVPPRPTSPPTRAQYPEVVSPDAPTRPTPRRTDPPTRREAGNTAHREFPSGLRDRYEPHGVAGAGSEGTVWHVRRLADGSDAAVKVAHPGQAMDMDTLEHLATPEFRRHVPRIHDFGEIPVGPAVCGWVAMEYLPTALDDHLTRQLRGGQRRDDHTRTEHTVRELADLLDFWQTRIDRNPLDLKPANILVRERPDGAPEFVVADFGGIAKFTASQSYRDFQITALYMAPEQIVHQNLKATPWWTLGLVLYQVFTGRPLYVLDDDARITDEAWTRGLILHSEVDLSAVTDARQNLLLQGLLTKDPDDRWTAAEIHRWLKGETPDVVRPSAPTAPTAARHANRPITFRGQAHHEAESLAAAMAQHSEAAAKWLMKEGGPRLAAWLREDLSDTAYDSEQLLTLNRGRDGQRLIRASVAALAFVAVFAPTATPQYRGRRVDAEGIARIAQGGEAVGFVEELLAASVPTVAAGFVCGHEQCTDGRCQVLLTLADELPRTLDRIRTEAGTLKRRGDHSTDGALNTYETNFAYGLAAALIVHPGNRRRALVPLAGLPGVLAPLATKAPVALLVFLAHFSALRHQALAVLRRRKEDAGFLRSWADLHRRAAGGDPATVPGRAALVAAAALLPRVLRADALGTDHQVTLREWWSASRIPLAQRLIAAATLCTLLWLLIWSGAVFRYVYDTDLGWAALWPGDTLIVPLTRAANAAIATQAGLCAVALAGALAFAAAPARLNRPLLLAVALLAGYLGYARPDLPPLDLLHLGDDLAERLRHLEGGWRSGNGLVALVIFPLGCVALGVLARWLLGQARTAEETQAGLRRERAERRRVRAGLPARPHHNVRQWRTGADGTRDRVQFGLAALLTLVTVLWAAVEIRVALLSGEHRTLASWGTGQQGASYQSQYLLVCAAICAAAALCRPAGARRVWGWAVVAVTALGLLPPPVEPAQALSVPVLHDLFTGLAATWGHGAFWAALLLALPLSVYAGGFAVRRTRRAAR
ncbi:hypothetical protein ACFVT2_25225 [Streptomyces sp. NPDC058000]|uniref:protein kinase domain-containing protein n=1 Tax=Streptomyces sp. NPDC058000 TaxID=3346299 RepID=UPI0036E60BB1